MNSNSYTIIKLGGSVITDKTKYARLNKTNLKRIAEELSNWDNQMIIVHGAGSYGHIVANDYNIIDGYKNVNQIEGLLKIRKDMNVLNNIVVQELVVNNINALGFQTSALTYLNSKRDEVVCFFEPIKKALQLKLVPVLSGDIIFDEITGFSIYSGDQLIEELSMRFPIKQVVFITDSDGLWIKDSSNKPKLLEYASLKELKDIELFDIKNDESVDVTGKMKGKLESIISLLEQVKKIIIVNGQKRGRVKSILKGNSETCTVLKVT